MLPPLVERGNSPTTTTRSATLTPHIDGMLRVRAREKPLNRVNTTRVVISPYFNDYYSEGMRSINSPGSTRNTYLQRVQGDRGVPVEQRHQRPRRVPNISQGPGLI